MHPSEDDVTGRTREIPEVCFDFGNNQETCPGRGTGPACGRGCARQVMCQKKGRDESRPKSNREVLKRR